MTYTIAITNPLGYVFEFYCADLLTACALATKMMLDGSAIYAEVVSEQTGEVMFHAVREEEV